MPKYILIGLGITIVIFLIMHFWTKLSDRNKNRTIASIFGVIAITFVLILSLLLF